MIEKVKTLLWFARRPSHYRHAMELFSRKLRTDHDGPASVHAATRWAAEHALPVRKALLRIGLLENEELSIPVIPEDLLVEGRQLAEGSPVRMGGPGDLDLLHTTVILSGAKRVVETGVAYGWSSLAILSGLERSGGKLVSVDMPYPKASNDDFVGIAVPQRFRASWEIIREPDRKGLEKAIAKFGGQIDLCHYDSDKSWWGRQYAFPLIWQALVRDGILISDDIQDNLAFAEFVEQQQVAFAVTESSGKYVGIVRKK